MNRRFVLLAAPILMALTAAAPAKKKAALPPPPPTADYVMIALTTTLGTIEVELDHKHAPLTVENILRYVDQKRLDNSAFYRAMHLAWGKQPNGLVQAGVQMDPKRTLKPVAHEPTSQTGLTHKAGTLSLARNAPGTGMAEFSILLSDLTSFDADPKSADPEAQAGYAAFGRVTTGMDVVRKIWDQPISQTKGQGAMRGQMLEVPVKILTVRRLPVAAAPPPAPVKP
jgi:peptidyl-prolyl cis-trans isomerase A (cyclophilin A)